MTGRIFVSLKENIKLNIQPQSAVVFINPIKKTLLKTIVLVSINQKTAVICGYFN
jgi:hypothetical protein